MKKLLFKISFLTIILISNQSLAQTIPPANKYSMMRLPNLDILEKVALEKSGMDTEQIRQWQKGSRWSAALPRVQVGLESRFINQNTTVIQDNISVTSSGVSIGPASNRLDLDEEGNQNFEFRAVWSFDELLFNRNQLDVSRESRDLYLVRSRLIQELHQAYYDVKSLLLQFELEPQKSENPIEKLKFQQAFDRLNSLSQGALKNHMKNI